MSCRIISLSEYPQEGIAFNLVKAILKLNQLVEGKRNTEVIIMFKNSADTSLRIFSSIEHYGLDISRAALTSGNSLTPYLDAFSVDLFLSADESDVQDAFDAGAAAGIIFDGKTQYEAGQIDQIRIAFDGDAVLFSDQDVHLKDASKQVPSAKVPYKKINPKVDSRWSSRTVLCVYYNCS